MAIKVTLTNSSRITRRNPSTDTDEDTDILFSRSSYQKLGSLVKNKTLLEAYNDGSLSGEYRRLLDDLNDLYLKVNYPEQYSDLTLADNIEKLDEYLGSLGVEVDYPYAKDASDIPVWLSTTKGPDERVLIDSSDNTYLTDSSGTNILVRY